MADFSNDSALASAANSTVQGAEWWRGAVIYQVYPRSFQDTSGNGVGDLKGVVQRVPYIASLGVDAIWVSPFFKSPMKDFGYDVSDFKGVDPLFGDIGDFKALLDTAHAHGLKVIIDQVLSHTSDQHAWFEESRQSRTNDKADWYVWADPKEDGSEPNNWWAIFGGRAWEWEPARQQYYLHNFLVSQPDLNYHNEVVQQAVLEEIEFWLALGVDGFRLDAINFCTHDAQLRDNPEKPESERKARGFSSDNPYAAQYHLYDNTQPENLAFMKKIRALMDRYPGTVTLGEVNSEDSLGTMIEYTSDGDKLHMTYSFELLSDEYGADYMRDTVGNLQERMVEGWPCWAISNHDVERVVTRWGNNAHRDAFAKMSLAMAASLRGTLCVYQGEELGLCEAPIQKEELQDPFGIEFWPEFKGRDGCRTPMVWEHDAANAGFSQQDTWLPIPDAHKARAVDIQSDDADSVLNFYRQFLAWRKQQPALVHGELTFMGESDHVLIFKRHNQSQTLWCCFNLSAEPVLVDEPMGAPIPLAGVAEPLATDSGWQLEPYQFSYFV